MGGRGHVVLVGGLLVEGGEGGGGDIYFDATVLHMGVLVKEIQVGG